MNFKDYKKVAEDQKSATLQHPKGHTIKVVKHVLSKGMQKELEALPKHYDEGGEVSSNDSEDNSNSANSQTSPPMPTIVINNGQPQGGYNLGNFAGQMANNPGMNMPPSEPAMQVTPEAPKESHGATGSWAPPASQPVIPQAPSDPFGAQAYSDAYMKGLNEQKGGNNALAVAEGAEGKAQENALQAGKALQANQSNYQNQFEQLNNERNFFQSDIANSHVDPKQYIDNMSTGQHIRTMIGLVLGGMGAGLTHTSNPVLDSLNSRIEQNIDAQKSNIGNKKTLLEANLRQYGNLRDAADMTRINYMDMIKNQVAAEAAKSQGPMARARAQQANGVLDTQSAQILSQMAVRRSLGQQMQQQGGGLSQMDPAQAVRGLQMSGLINPEQADKAQKEVSVLTARQKALNAADSLMSQQSKLQTLGSRLGSPLQSQSQLDALHASLVPMILDAAPSKRLTPEAVQQEINPWAIKFTDNAATRQWKLGQLKKYVLQQSDDTPNLRSMGITGAPLGSGGSIKESAPKAPR